MRRRLAYLAISALAAATGAGLISIGAAQQRDLGTSGPAASNDPFLADLLESYQSPAYKDFLYDERITPHVRGVHRVFMAQAFAAAGQFGKAEAILDRVTTYGDLPGNAPIHLHAEDLQMQMREAMALAEPDPERRRRIYRPLIYYALGRARAFRDPATRERVANRGLRAARHNQNQDAIDRFNQILDRTEQP